MAADISDRGSTRAAIRALVYTIREPKRRGLLRARDGQATELSFRQTLSEMGGRWQSVLGLSLGMIFQSSCAFAMLSWTPTFFQRTHHWTPGQAGRLLALILVTFGCLGMYVGGVLSDRWHRRGMCNGALKIAVVSGIGTAILLPLALVLARADWTIALLAPGVFFIALPMGTSVAALQRIFPNQVRGQVSALFLFFLNLGGQTLGPLGPGFLNDRLFHNEGMIGPSMAITIGVAAALMVVVFLATLRPYRADYEAMHAAPSQIATSGAMLH